jgi:ribosomal-protein-alanine N-acetyltransferase
VARSDVLTAERLDLRPFSEEYLTSRYVAWLNDPETVRYSEQRHRRHTLETCRAYFESFANTASFFWAIVAHDKELGHIGNMTATVDHANAVADLAIMIGEARARGRGFGLEAWSCACNFLLTKARMRKVTAGTMAINVPMLRVMARSGMIEEGRRRLQFLHEGKAVDVVLAAAFADGHDGTAS